MNIKTILVGSALLLSLQACGAVYIATGAEAVKTIAQERSAGNRLDDNGIAVRINDAFLRKDFEDLFAGVSTNVIEGRVLLTGTVSKPELKNQAAEMTWKIAGVREVINEIQVVSHDTIQGYTNDAWVANYLRGKLALTHDIASSNYNVECVNGIVYIIGIGQDEHEIKVVSEIARTIKGVRKVVSHAITKTDSRRKDWQNNSEYHF